MWLKFLILNLKTDKVKFTKKNNFICKHLNDNTITQILQKTTKCLVDKSGSIERIGINKLTKMGQLTDRHSVSFLLKSEKNCK